MPSALSLSALTMAPSICEVRLTLETGVAVSTTDQLAKTSVFLTPHRGNRLALYDGTGSWKLHAITSDLALALGTKTAALPYDVFGYDNGTPRSRIWRGPTPPCGRPPSCRRTASW
jgi:hypothetical protein